MRNGIMRILATIFILMVCSVAEARLLPLFGRHHVSCVSGSCDVQIQPPTKQTIQKQVNPKSCCVAVSWSSGIKAVLKLFGIS